MANCPVCEAEYEEGQDNYCSSCCWPLKLTLTLSDEVKQALVTWAKQRWVEKCKLESDNQKLSSPSVPEPQLKILEKQLKIILARVDGLEESQKQDLQSQLDELNSKYENGKQSFSEVKKEVETFKSEYLKTQEQMNKIQTELDELKGDVKAQSRINLGSSYRVNQPVNQDANPRQNPSSEQKLSRDEYELVQQYNSIPKNLPEYNEVSETAKSINDRRVGSVSTIIFENKSRGNYWILKKGGRDYLVPSNNLRINQHNYKTVEVVFECRDYQPESSTDFKLLKPAKVFALSGGDTWQLEEPGILQF